jgi:SAM-dependent methyltransferase
LWQSTLEPAIDSGSHALDEEHRAEALRPIRDANFERILARLSALMRLEGRRLLDVGCGHGWFLTAANACGMQTCGIEPDSRIAGVARTNGLQILNGYFPACLEPGDTFDVVVFNDVLEHIPGVHHTLAACAATIPPGGFLVLSVPTSAGTLFRLARWLAAWGIRGPWHRLWQKAFPSPHLYYFDRGNLELALRDHGFSAAHAEGTDVFRPRGLWARMRFDRHGSIVASAALYVGLLLLYPIYRLAGRADTDLLIYRRAAATTLTSSARGR